VTSGVLSRLVFGALIVGAAVAGGCGGGGLGRGVGLRSERYVAPADVVQVRWRQHLTEEPLIEYKPQEFASAVSDGRRVYVGSSGGSLWAFDVRDGTIIWRAPTRGGIAGQPLIARESRAIFVGTQDGALHAIDLATGKIRWTYDVRGPIDSQPAWADGVVYFTTGENRIYALDARTGAWRWQYERESPEGFTVRGLSSPLVHDRRVYVGFSDGTLACLSASSGEVVWTRALAGEATRFLDVDSTPVIDEGVLYASAHPTGVYALDPKTGATRWRYDVEGAGTVRPAGGLVFFAAARAGLHALDREGRLVWRQALASAGELSAPLVVGGHLVVSSANGGAYIADAATGRLEQFLFTGHGATGAPTTDGRQVYLLSNGGYFYALALKRPSQTFIAGAL
jgi:outer membrane protein assembly factor BamB